MGSHAGITILTYIYQPCMIKFQIFFNEWGQKVCSCSEWTVRFKKKETIGVLQRYLQKRKKEFFQLSKKRKKKLVPKKTNCPPKEFKTRAISLREQSWDIENYERDIRIQTVEIFTFQYNYCRHTSWYKNIPSIN